MTQNNDQWVKEHQEQDIAEIRKAADIAERGGRLDLAKLRRKRADRMEAKMNRHYQCLTRSKKPS